MARGSSEFKYEVNPDFDFIIEESSMGNICLRKISWNDRPEKLDLRKYTYADGQEKMLKGISLSDEAADELTCVLVENGYGDPRRILRGLSTRDTFEEDLEHYTEIEAAGYDDDGSEDFYDPSQLVEYKSEEDEEDSEDAA